MTIPADDRREAGGPPMTTPAQLERWRAKWAADRRRYAATYVPGAVHWSRAPSSINTISGKNKPPKADA